MRRQHVGRFSTN